MEIGWQRSLLEGVACLVFGSFFFSRITGAKGAKEGEAIAEDVTGVKTEGVKTEGTGIGVARAFVSYSGMSERRSMV